MNFIEGGLQLLKMMVSQNLLLHSMGIALHDNAILLKEYICMVGNLFGVQFLEEVNLAVYVGHPPTPEVPDTAEEEEECGSHGDPDKVDLGKLLSLD